MFDLSQVAEGLKAAVPPASFLSFKLDELNFIRSSIEYLRSSYLKSLNEEHIEFGKEELTEEIEILTRILDKIDNYEFH